MVRLQRLELPPLPRLNQIIEDNRVYSTQGKRRIYRYAKVKAKWAQAIKLKAHEQSFQPIEEAAFFTLLCFEKNRMYDPDNIVSGAWKILLDGLKVSGLIQGDGWKHVRGLAAYWDVHKTHPRAVLYVASGWMAREYALLLEEQHQRKAENEVLGDS